MKVYIECFRADGSQILGNCDGQAVIRAKNYRRTLAYKHLAEVVGNPKWMGGKVAFARVVTESGQILETVNPIIKPDPDPFDVKFKVYSGYLSRQKGDHTAMILERLRKLFAETQVRNPRGYRDQFDSQFDMHCSDIAHELGGTFEVVGDEYVFKFIP
jgi:hypothetical protein